jgi:hypothetical protein
MSWVSYMSFILLLKIMGFNQRFLCILFLCQILEALTYISYFFSVSQWITTFLALQPTVRGQSLKVWGVAREDATYLRNIWNSATRRRITKRRQLCAVERNPLSSVWHWHTIWTSFPFPCTCMNSYIPNLMFCWPCVILNQYSKTNLTHFSFSWLWIKTSYMFRALPAHPQ